MSSIFDQTHAFASPILLVEPLAMGPDTFQISQQKKIKTAILITGWEYPSPPDPLLLSFSEFVKLGYSEVKQLEEEVSRRVSRLLDDRWKSGKRQVVVCADEIVYETDSLEDIPNEFVMDLAKKLNKACFVFSAPDIVEECAWTPTAPPFDDYPTLPIYIGEELSDETEIEDSTVFSKVNADFDTGTPTLKAFSAQVLPGPLRSYSAPLRETEHLGKKYKYYVKKAKICIRTISKKTHGTTRDIRVVEEWTGSALLQASPNRVGIVGRSLIRDLSIKVELDPTSNTTRIHEPASTVS